MLSTMMKPDDQSLTSVLLGLPAEGNSDRPSLPLSGVKFAV
jgi:hypothetical protein